MATYNELAAIINQEADSSSLRQKVQGALLLKSSEIRQEASPTQGRMDFAQRAAMSSREVALELLGFLLGDNAGASQAQILAANDAAVKTAVDAVVDKFYP